MQEHLLTTGTEIKSIYDARAISKFIRSVINHIENNSACSFHRTAGFYAVAKKKVPHDMDTELGRNSFEVNTRMELPQIGRACYGDFKMGCDTVRSERRCAPRLRHVDLVVSIEVAVEVCCCFTVFSC
jgi:hypothetical protein